MKYLLALLPFLVFPAFAVPTTDYESMTVTQYIVVGECTKQYVVVIFTDSKSSNAALLPNSFKEEQLSELYDIKTYQKYNLVTECI